MCVCGEGRAGQCMCDYRACVITERGAGQGRAGSTRCLRGFLCAAGRGRAAAPALTRPAPPDTRSPMQMDDTVGYGISSTLYDRLFGTLSQHLAKKAL